MQDIEIIFEILSYIFIVLIIILAIVLVNGLKIENERKKLLK